MEAAMTAQVQQVVQQMAGVQPGQAAGNSEQLLKSLQQQTSKGGFAALLQQMLGGNGQNALLGVGQQQEAMLVEQLRKQLGQEGTEMGMQLLAEMIAVNPGFVQQVDTAELMELMGQAQPAQGVLPQAANTAQNLALVQELQQMAVSGQADPTGHTLLSGGYTAQMAPQTVLPEQNGLVQILTPQTKQSGTGAQTVEGSVLQQTTQTVPGAAQSGAAQGDGLAGQAQFQRALFQTQQKLTQGAEVSVEATGQKDKKETEVSTDNVIRLPEQIRFEQLGNTKALAELTTVDAKDLLQQVKTGLTEGMNSGKNEFIIKLKPDGLGEITVRMLEEAGKITMSITTASAQTQRILNNELAVLRDAVRPYNVEVQHVESQNTQNFNLDQQRQQNLTQQQQQQQNRQAQQQGWYSGYDFAEEQPEIPQEMLRYATTGLNTVV